MHRGGPHKSLGCCWVGKEDEEPAKVTISIRSVKELLICIVANTFVERFTGLERKLKIVKLFVRPQIK